MVLFVDRSWLALALLPFNVFIVYKMNDRIVNFCRIQEQLISESFPCVASAEVSGILLHVGGGMCV